MGQLGTRLYGSVKKCGPLLLWLQFSAGVICVRFLPELPTSGQAGAVTALLLLLSWRFGRWRLPLVFCFGVGWAATSAALVLEKGIPVDLQKQDLVAIVKVVGLPQPMSYGSRFEAKVETLSHEGRRLASPGLVRLGSYDRHVSPQPGERWRFVVRLKQPRGLANPGAGFNRETWLFAQRIRAQGYIVKGEARRLKAATVSTPIHHPGLSVLALRSGFAAFIDRQVSGEVVAGILGAVSVGIRSELGDAAFRVLQDTGTIHLVAISGLHIGLVSMLCGLLAGRLWRLSGQACAIIPALSVAASVGLFAGLGYALLAGFTLPTRRATCMLAVVVVALLSRRRPKPLTVIIAVMAVVLAIDPLASFSSSFWLSFTAVAVLVAVTAGDRTHSPRSPPGSAQKLYRVARNWSRIQLWLLIGMLPVLLCGFQKASIAAPLGNLIAIPIIGLAVVPLSLAALVCWMVGVQGLSGRLLDMCEWLIEIIWVFLELLASQSWAVWYQGLPPMWTIVTGGLGVLFLVAGRYLPGRWLGLLWLLPMLVITPAHPEPGSFRLLLLDVGQGLAAIVQTRNRFMVFDTGAAWSSGFSMGRVAVLPALRQLGAGAIDKLVISHGDNDHIGGAAAILDHYPRAPILTSVAEVNDAPGGASRCHEGMQWQWDGVRFDVLWPPPGQRYSGNDSSCVIRISSEAGSVLLTGDIEQDAERRLVSHSAGALASDVLVVPHHGSKTSSTSRFLNAVSPRVGLVSAGYLNRFGHPASAVRARFGSRDIPLFNTAEEGALTLEFGAGGISIGSERGKTRGFWLSSSNTVLAFGDDLPVLQSNL